MRGLGAVVVGRVLELGCGSETGRLACWLAGPSTVRHDGRLARVRRMNTIKRRAEARTSRWGSSCDWLRVRCLYCVVHLGLRHARIMGSNVTRHRCKCVMRRVLLWRAKR